MNECAAMSCFGSSDHKSLVPTYLSTYRGTYDQSTPASLATPEPNPTNLQRRRTGWRDGEGDDLRLRRERGGEGFNDKRSTAEKQRRLSSPVSQHNHGATTERIYKPIYLSHLIYVSTVHNNLHSFLAFRGPPFSIISNRALPIPFPHRCLSHKLIYWVSRADLLSSFFLFLRSSTSHCSSICRSLGVYCVKLCFGSWPGPLPFPNRVASIDHGFVSEMETERKECVSCFFPQPRLP